MDYSLNLDKLEDVIERQQSHQSQLKQHLDQVDAAVKKLHQNWSGDAALAHLEAHKSWQHGFDEMAKGLKEMKSAAETALHNYNSALSTNVEMWRGL